MSKKKKKSRKSKSNSESSRSNFFWRQVAVFILVVVAFFLLIGGFGWGGVLPVKLFDIASWGLGLIAYVLPFVLIYLAVQKFRDEQFTVPLSRFIGSLLLLICLAGSVHVFISRDEAAKAASQGTFGGEVGYLASSGLLMFLSSTTAFVILLMIAWVSFMIMFGLSPKEIFKKLSAIFKREDKTNFEELKQRDDTKFEIHEGVPIVHHENDKKEEYRPRMPKIAATAKMISEPEHAALTTIKDPDWRYPELKLLNDKQDKADPGDTKANAEIIRSTLANFNIVTEMEGANVGPKVTQYTLKPQSGQKLSKIASHESDIAYELAAKGHIRIEAPIPGKRAVGVEVPNDRPATVRLHSLLSSREWSDKRAPLLFGVGKDIAGKPIVDSLDKMPHLLIAGTTGSGKSVMINTLLISLLYRNSPSDLKLILVDPKQVELMPYNDIPHLLTPVITETEKCISALKWSVAEMERRLKTFSAEGKRNIGEYNEYKKEEGMPYIVIVIDEMADLMMSAGRDLEALIVRIAQKARAAGIHLVLATQSPRVDVITGLIKANVPSRIAFTVVNQVDSRVIMDQVGAEKLLGSGDMLYATIENSKPVRLQGALIEKKEVDAVIDFIKQQREPQYDDEVISMPVQLSGRGSVVAEFSDSSASDDMWKDAVTVVVGSQKASTSLLQRRLRIGYGRASRIIDQMEERGIVGPADGSRPREILVSSVEEALGNTSGGTDFDEPVSDDPQDEYLTR